MRDTAQGADEEGVLDMDATRRWLYELDWKYNFDKYKNNVKKMNIMWINNTIINF